MNERVDAEGFRRDLLEASGPRHPLKVVTICRIWGWKEEKGYRPAGLIRMESRQLSDTSLAWGPCYGVDRGSGPAWGAFLQEALYLRACLAPKRDGKGPVCPASLCA